MTNRTRKKRTQKRLDDICRMELLTGPSFLAGAGYFGYTADDFECDRNRMERDWNNHRDELLTEWISEHPGTRPAGWWEFDASDDLRALRERDCPRLYALALPTTEKPDLDAMRASERDLLEQAGELTAEEV